MRKCATPSVGSGRSPRCAEWLDAAGLRPVRSPLPFVAQALRRSRRCDHTGCAVAMTSPCDQPRTRPRNTGHARCGARPPGTPSPRGTPTRGRSSLARRSHPRAGLPHAALRSTGRPPHAARRSTCAPGLRRADSPSAPPPRAPPPRGRVDPPASTAASRGRANPPAPVRYIRADFGTSAADLAAQVPNSALCARSAPVKCRPRGTLPTPRALAPNSALRARSAPVKCRPRGTLPTARALVPNSARSA